MFGSDILDVAIGMILMLLATSLACSAINEFVEGLLKNRARDLDRGLRELLADRSTAGLVSQIYAHPLISGLYQGAYSASTTKNLPSYIPARTFATALMDLLQPADANKSSGAASTSTVKPVVSALMPGVGRGAMQQFRQTLTTLPDSPVKTAILSLVDAAGDDPVAARQNIENWYNAAMDRVSGWYKRRTQFILTGIGLTVAVVMNVDSIAFARYLSTSKAARELVISHASSTASKAISTSMPTPADLTASIQSLNQTAGIPLGWRLPPAAGSSGASSLAEYRIDPQRVPDTLGDWVTKLIGFSLTAIAVSLGAPFWFDVLNKFMVVRSTIKPEEKSQDESSKD